MTEPNRAPEPGDTQELSEDTLESVSGGAFRSPIKDICPPPIITLPPYDPIEPIICPVEPLPGDLL
jgi:hypothetical protein